MLRFGNVNNMPKSGMRPIDTNLPPVCPRDPILLFDGRDVHCNVSEIGFTEKEFDKNMLVVGNIGSGKTNMHCLVLNNRLFPMLCVSCILANI